MATNRDWALKMIPVLVRWAQAAWDKPHYYSDLSASVGHKTNQIGNVMGTIDDIIKELERKSEKRIPTLNCLVQNRKSGLPSDGFDYVVKSYSKLSDDSKRGEVRKLNEDAHHYDWRWVLKELGLKPATVINQEKLESMKSTQYGSGGEGKEHKEIKNYIAEHPASIGIKGVINVETEHDLLSGDRLDVHFKCRKGRHVAVEVKPSSSPDADIMRGIFQCIKYQAVMDASRVVDNDNYDNEVILVIARPMSPEAKQIAIDLGVKFIDNFKMTAK